MQDLFIDIGNSFIKAAIYTGGGWSVVFRGETSDERRFLTWLDERKDNRIIVCSVHNEVTQKLNRRYSESKLKFLSNRDIPGKLIQYDTQETLGMDRFLTCFAASLISGGAAVVIDAGSACTVDYITAESVFQGGIIMPGHRLMVHSVKKDLPALPGPDELIPTRWPGKSSLDSVRWGTTGAFMEAIKGFLALYTGSFGEFNLFITGGDAHLIKKYLNDKFPLKEHPFLLFEGMKSFESEYLQHQQ